MSFAFTDSVWKFLQGLLLEKFISTQNPLHIHDFHNGGSLRRNGNYHHQREARKAFAQPHMAFDL